MTKTIDLYTPLDVKRVREFLAEEQEGKDALTGLPLPVDKRCLDHDHKTQLVRGVLHRQVNAALGKLEGVHTRYLSTWFDGTLPDFLRLSADYLEKEPDTRWYHNGWLRRISISFNQLTEGQKKQVLVQLGQPEGKNSKDRKELFRKVSLDRQHGFEKLIKVISTVKEQS